MNTPKRLKTGCLEPTNASTPQQQVLESDDDSDSSSSPLEDEPETTPLWMIDDDTLFQPDGLINHCIDQYKSVFVTWNEDYLLNYRFKKSEKSNTVDMTKVRILLPADEGEIVEVHILDFNTLLLMSSGRVYYFSSLKSLHPLNWLTGVRCFSRIIGSIGFSIIRHDVESNRLLLETYNDVINIGKTESTLQLRHDITYDEQNIFNCTWQDDKFTLYTFTVDMEDIPFLNAIIGSKILLQPKQQIHIFSINGHVYSLTTNLKDVESSAEHIQLLCVYAIPVEFIKFLPKLNLCLIFLTTGSIDIWYVSMLTKLKQRQMHHTGTEFLDFDATCNNGVFYYTDGEQIVRLKFEYDRICDKCLVHDTIKYIKNMVACTWVEHLQQLVCISVNNVFYRIEFVDTTKDLNNDIYELTDLTPAMVKRLSKNLDVIEELERTLTQLHKDIEEELRKQQLMAVAHKADLYDQLFETELRYVQHLPTFDAETLLLHVETSQKMSATNIYALLRIKLKCTNEIFNTALWQLHIYHNRHIHVLPMSMDMLHKRCCIIVIPLQKHINNTLPDFVLRLGTIVQVGSQTRAILLPISLKETAATYAGLFSATTISKFISYAPDLQSIIRFYQQQYKVKTTEICARRTIAQNFKLPAHFQFTDILQMLKINNNEVETVMKPLEFYFNDQTLRITYSATTHSLLIETQDATAIHYLKLFLMLQMQSLRHYEDATILGSELTDETRDKLLSLVMKYQSEVECISGQLTSSSEEQSSIQLQMEQLQAIYKKMRQELYI